MRSTALPPASTAPLESTPWRSNPFTAVLEQRRKFAELFEKGGDS